LDTKRRKVGYWCITVAGTRGGSLNIAVQLWLKYNGPHKAKGEDELGDSHKITEGSKLARNKNPQIN